MINLINHAENFLNRICIREGNRSFTYNSLLNESQKLAQVLLGHSSDLNENRVAFMVSPGFNYLKTQWAIWQAGGIAVPMCLDYPPHSLQFIIDETAATFVVYSEKFEGLINQLQLSDAVRKINLNQINTAEFNNSSLPDIQPERKAMILFTSGTTSKPKGVVTTHANIEAQITSLTTAWQWQQTDETLCVLPLHHIHGIINIIGCALWSGASCDFMNDSFSPKSVLDYFFDHPVNVFMAVPTIYYKLITYISELPESERVKIHHRLRSMRLMVSGSAALPVSVMEQWESISGHRLLERYGMTEIGMAISNPLEGERRAGHIGLPLTGVEVRLCDELDKVVSENEAGEIQVKGKNVFLNYWNLPEATSKSFTSDGWFKTGDVAVVSDGYYKILGRSSVDIIKSGGYKLSAIEIEEVLRQHEVISDCSVVGIEDAAWGELVCAALVLKKDISTSVIEQWINGLLPKYKTPKRYLIVVELPRNAMGKVIKPEVKKLFI
jgi:malonyl-CoA/methylmalonyl-CoA synthetase